MGNIQRIIKYYNLNYWLNSEGSFIAIQKIGEIKSTRIFPSKTLRLYFMFGEKFDTSTIEELIKSKKVIKITAFELYKQIYDYEQFIKVITAYEKYKVAN